MTHYHQLTKAEKAKRDEAARDALLALTDQQLAEVGVMFVMSNLGLEWDDRPESMAESDEMYEMFQVEIIAWQARLKRNFLQRNWKRDVWGCHEDLPQMIEEAKRRCPADGRPRPHRLTTKELR
jgi:hypothetical protein